MIKNQHLNSFFWINIVTLLSFPLPKHYFQLLSSLKKLKTNNQNKEPRCEIIEHKMDPVICYFLICGFFSTEIKRKEALVKGK